MNWKWIGSVWGHRETSGVQREIVLVHFFIQFTEAGKDQERRHWMKYFHICAKAQSIFRRRSEGKSLHFSWKRLSYLFDGPSKQDKCFLGKLYSHQKKCGHSIPKMIQYWNLDPYDQNAKYTQTKVLLGELWLLKTKNMQSHWWHFNLKAVTRVQWGPRVKYWIFLWIPCLKHYVLLSYQIVSNRTGT